MGWSRDGGVPVTRGDWLVGAIVAALIVASAVTGTGPVGPSGGWDYRAVVVGVLVGRLIVVRRRMPFVAVALANVATLGWLAAGFPTRTIVLAPLVALYAVGSARGLRSAVVATALTTATTAVAIYVVFDGSGFDDRFVNAVSLELGAAALGVVVHQRRSQLAAMADLAERTAQARAEQVRRESAEHQVRMARELHDVVGHTLAAVRSRPEPRCTSATAGPSRPARPSGRSPTSAGRPSPRSRGCSASCAGRACPSARPPVADPIRVLVVDDCRPSAVWRRAMSSSVPGCRAAS